MKFNKILLALFMALSGTVLQSCLKNQEDLFDEPASLRVQNLLDRTKQILMDAPQGWVLDYYPDRNISYGGFVYTLKFDKQEVNVGCELAPGISQNSLYKLSADNGPTLSFDSYNDLMHYFATPSSTRYQAYDGDYEFSLVDVASDMVTLRGKRTGNIMYMRPLETDSEQYLENVVNISDNMFLTSATGTAGSVSIDAAIDLDTRYMDIYTVDGDNAEVIDGSYFVPTPTGIRFLSPVNVGDGTVEVMDYDISEMVYTGVTSTGVAVTLAGSLPPTYSKIDEYSGAFVINYRDNARKVNVTLVPDKANNCVYIKGLNANFDVVANYSKSRGCIEINSQPVGEEGSNTVWMCAWALDRAAGTGSLTWDTTAGMFVIKDPEAAGTYNFTTNANTNYVTTSFIMWYLSGTSSVGQANNSKWYLNGSSQFTYLTTLVKQ